MSDAFVQGDRTVGFEVIDYYNANDGGQSDVEESILTAAPDDIDELTHMLDILGISANMQAEPSIDEALTLLENAADSKEMFDIERDHGDDYDDYDIYAKRKIAIDDSWYGAGREQGRYQGPNPPTFDEFKKQYEGFPDADQKAYDEFVKGYQMSAADNEEGMREERDYRYNNIEHFSNKQAAARVHSIFNVSAADAWKISRIVQGALAE